MATYKDAQTEWEQALKAAGSDEVLAERTLLARIVLELQDQSSRLQALMESAESGPFFKRRR